jgi:phosphate transport system substrate-binding protein
VYPITEAVAEEFQKAEKNAIKVTVGISGTGGGFKKFCRGEIDISDASRPILKKEMEACAAAGIKYFELPVAFDALTVVVNPKNTFIKQMTVEELKKMWEPAAQGKITRWNQVNPAWPDQPLKLFGAGADSGTFDYFTEAIVGKAKSSRGDYTASEDDNVLVQGVTPGRQRARLLRLRLLRREHRQAEGGAHRQSEGQGGAAERWTTCSTAAYEPLSRPIFIYVSEKAYERAEVKKFVEFYMKHGAKLSREVKYVPLPDKAYTTNLDHLKKGKLGTVFGGVAEVGITIEELQKREGKL